MIQHLGEKREAYVEKRQEVFKKDLEELKYKQTDEQYSNWNEREHYKELIAEQLRKNR